MKSVFADTAAWIAALNLEDWYHAHTMKLLTEFHAKNIPVVASEFVLLELVDALRAPYWRPHIVEFVGRLYESDHCEIVPLSCELLKLGLSLFERRPDKEWCLTDCISMEVMRKRGIAEVITSDHHFEQAGYQCLLRD